MTKRNDLTIGQVPPEYRRVVRVLWDALADVLEEAEFPARLDSGLRGKALKAIARAQQLGVRDPVLRRRENAIAKQNDLTVEGGGSLYLLRPRSCRGEQWIEEHLSKDRQEFSGAVVVEHQYIADIVAGAQADGLAVR